MTSSPKKNGHTANGNGGVEGDIDGIEDKDFEYDFLVKFLALGDSNVGKTAILTRFTEGKFTNRFHQTVGIDFKEKRLTWQSQAPESSLFNKSQRIQIQLWDTAGQERFRSLTTAFYRDAMGFVLVFDLTSEQSFTNVRGWIEQLRMHAYCDNPDVVLLGNKADLVDSRVIDERRANLLAEHFEIPYFETSAVTGDSIEQAIACLLDMVMLRVEKSIDVPLQLPIRRNTGRRVRPTEEKSSCGC